jgi:dihydrofolate synthase/folylpolyglutamate synthase
VAALVVVDETGMPVPDEAIRRGLAEVKWPGRLEVLGRGPSVVVDGAHNVDSVRVLLEAVDELFDYRRLVLVFGVSTGGISAGKDVEGILKLLLPRTKTAIFTKSRHPRATDPQQLAGFTKLLDTTIQPLLTTSVRDALSQALDLAGPDDLVLVTGSLFVVAEAREAWFAMTGGPMPERDPEREA